ncbi:hypothetical protein AZOA_32250 [Azoarcus sp. Aa7]|nr:hypothetical protein [Azoarcus sp. Aa7]
MSRRNEIEPQGATKYCRRFGQLAMQLGYIDADHLAAALRRQREDAAAGRPHRLVGAILFQEGTMSTEQIEETLRAVFRDVPR